MLTVYISEVLDSAFFRVVASIFTLLVFMLWGTLAIMTVYDLSEHREELLNASCLPDSGIATVPIETKPNNQPPTAVV